MARRGYGEVLGEVRIRNMAGDVVATINANDEFSTSRLLRTALAAGPAAAEEEQSGAVSFRKVVVDGSNRPLSINDHVWTDEICVVAMQVRGA
jgi:hypothetical protein